MAKPFTVFYGDQVYGEYDSMAIMRWAIPRDSDAYQGSYVYWAALTKFNLGWYRPNGTPVLLEDVPKKLRMLQLVLGL